MVGTLAVDGWVVTLGTVRMWLGRWIDGIVTSTKGDDVFTFVCLSVK